MYTQKKITVPNIFLNGFGVERIERNGFHEIYLNSVLNE